jgi:hypothetical protein
MECIRRISLTVRQRTPVRGLPRYAQRPPGQAAAHGATVQLVDGMRAVVGAQLTLEGRQVHAEQGEQVGGVPARPVATT